jgi:hypothetical protein
MAVNGAAGRAEAKISSHAKNKNNTARDIEVCAQMLPGRRGFEIKISGRVKLLLAFQLFSVSAFCPRARDEIAVGVCPNASEPHRRVRFLFLLPRGEGQDEGERRIRCIVSRPFPTESIRDNSCNSRQPSAGLCFQVFAFSFSAFQLFKKTCLRTSHMIFFRLDLP